MSRSGGQLVVTGQLGDAPARGRLEGGGDLPDPGLLFVDLDEGVFVITPRVLDEARVRLRGELDLLTQPILAEALALAIRSEPPMVTLDLRGLTFIDVRCACALVAVSKRLRSWGGTLDVLTAHGSVRRVLGLLGVTELLEARPPPPILTLLDDAE